ncbi:MAG TPA: MBL fold metallo-hydrolase, partial [Niabella sp.]|nr:MBL fold metallo-hydrolase [Niabella sp.]
MKFTYYGQSCFSINLGGKIFLFDPFINGNDLAKDIDIDSISADYILVSHGHGDHVGDLIPIAKRTNALVIS